MRHESHSWRNKFNLIIIIVSSSNRSTTECVAHTRSSFRNVNQLWIIFTKVNYHFRSSNFIRAFLSSHCHETKDATIRWVVFIELALKVNCFVNCAAASWTIWNIIDSICRFGSESAQRVYSYEGSYLINWLIYIYFFHFEPKHLPNYNIFSS